KPDDSIASVHRDWMYIKLRTPWKVDDKMYPAGVLLAIRFEAFLKGDRTFDILFEPTERKSLAGYLPTLHHVILNELDNVANGLYVLTPSEGKWKREPLPEEAHFSSVHAGAVDADESDDYFMTVDGYLTPSTLYLGMVGGKPAEKLKSTPS